MRWCAIANVDAGRPGHAETVGADLLAQSKVEDLVIATAPGDTRRACSRSTFDGFVIIGGDGTIAAALSAIDRDQQCLAVIPCGHGNCLARAIGVDTETRAFQALATCRVASIDLMNVRAWRADGAPCEFLAASTLAVGYVADVVQFGRRRLPALGRYSYAAASLLQGTQTARVRLTIDGAPTEALELTGLVINNTPHLANFRAFRAARLDDGRFDVMLMAAGHARQVLHNLAVVAGSASFGPLRIAQAEVIEVELSAPGMLMADGEFVTDVARLEVGCLPRGLRIVTAAAWGVRP